MARRTASASGAPGEYVEVLNGPEFEAHLSAIARRAARPEPGLSAMFKVLEAGEERLFASYGGKYVLTGALRASLTGGGSGAIRELIPGGLKFGSSIPYSIFQGTTGVGEHSGPSAVLKTTETERVLAGRMVLDYILHGGGGVIGV